MSVDIRPREVIVSEFNKSLNDLINWVANRTVSELDDAKIRQIKSRLSLLKSTSGLDCIIEVSRGRFLPYKDILLTREAFIKFIRTNKLESLMVREITASGHTVDSSSFVSDLMAIINRAVQGSTETSLNVVHTSLLTLYTTSIEYECVVGQ